MRQSTGSGREAFSEFGSPRFYWGTFSLLVTYLLTRKLFDTRTALIAVILALAIPGNCLLSFVLTIDAPLVLAWSLALYFFWKFVRNEQPGWSLVGLFFCLGLGISPSR